MLFEKTANNLAMSEYIYSAISNRRICAAYARFGSQSHLDRHEANNLRTLLKTCCLKMPADLRDGKPADFPFREEKENRNTDRSRGFLPVLWPEMRLAGSDSEVLEAPLII